MSFAFLEDATYIVSDAIGTVRAHSPKVAAVNRLAEMMDAELGP